MKEDIIYQYLDGELSGAALTDIKQRINRDKPFAEEVALIQDMRSFATAQEKEAKAKAAIRDVGEQYKPQPLESKAVRPSIEKAEQSTDRSPKSKLMYMIPAAIAAVVLLGIFITQTMTTQQMTPESLYASYATVTPLSFATRQATTDEVFLNAQTLFNEKNYAAALPYFNTILQENPTNNKAIYYQGFAKIAIDDEAGGRTDLELLLSNTLYQHTARFHLALSYLKTDNVDLARVLLLEIPESSNHYEDAQEILRKI